MPDALGHIEPGDIVLSYPAPGFGDLVTDILGNAGGPDDGFDEAYAQTLSDLSTIQDALDLLDAILGLSILLGDPTGESDLVTNTPYLQANIANVTADLAALNALALDVGITPPTSTPPPAPSGSAPPGSSGGTGGSTTECASSYTYPVTAVGETSTMLVVIFPGTSEADSPTLASYSIDDPSNSGAWSIGQVGYDCQQGECGTFVYVDFTPPQANEYSATITLTSSTGATTTVCVNGQGASTIGSGGPVIGPGAG